jgi:hypothetical protein
VFLDPTRPANKTKAAIAQHLAKHRLSAELFLTSIAEKGASEQKAWKKAQARSRR